MVDSQWPDYARKALPSGIVRKAKRLGSPFKRRAELMVECALLILGKTRDQCPGDLYVPLSVAQFTQELRHRYAAQHPELIFRTDATFERARLDRRRLPELPRVVLRQGPPPRSE